MMLPREISLEAEARPPMAAAIRSARNRFIRCGSPAAWPSVTCCRALGVGRSHFGSVEPRQNSASMASL